MRPIAYSDASAPNAQARVTSNCSATSTARALERGAELVAAAMAARIAGGTDVAHAPTPFATIQIAAVSTTVSAATVQPEA